MLEANENWVGLKTKTGKLGVDMVDNTLESKGIKDIILGYVEVKLHNMTNDFNFNFF